MEYWFWAALIGFSHLCRFSLQEPDRNPREDRHDNQTDHQRQQVTPIDQTNAHTAAGWFGLLEDPPKYLI